MAQVYLKNLANKTDTQIASITDNETDADNAYMEANVAQHLRGLTEATELLGITTDTYITFDATLTQAESKQKPVIVSGSHTLTSNKTITASALTFSRGGVLTVATGVTLTINAPFWAGSQQCFDVQGTGRVIFGQGSTQYVDPVWFGADPTGVANSGAAFNDAVNSLYASIAGGGKMSKLTIPKGEFIIETSITMKGWASLPATSVGIFEGAGIGKTILKAGTNLNAPVINIGGPNPTDGDNGLLLENFSVHGNSANQTTVGPAVKCERLDRSIFHNMHISDSKGVNFQIEASSIEVINCQFFSAQTDNIIVDGVNSTHFRGCYINNAVQYGIHCKFTNTILFSGQHQNRAAFEACHFEANESGNVYCDGFDNFQVINCEIKPYSTVSSDIILTGGTRNAQILYNKLVWSNEIATYHGGNGTGKDHNIVKIDQGCYANVVALNRHYTSGDGSATQWTPIDLELQVYDKDGRNYRVDPFRFQPQMIVANGLGGNYAAGWVTRNVQNFIANADQNDLTSANWVQSGITSVNNVTTVGSPLDTAASGGTASHVVFATTPGSPQVSTLTLTLSGLSIAAGDLVTFQLLARLPAAWVEGEYTDIRLHILDASDNILSGTSIVRRIKDDWADAHIACQMSATTTYSTLKVQIYKVDGSNTNQAVFWGMDCHVGDVGPILPGGQTINPGLAALNGAFLGRIDGNANTLNLETAANAPTVQVGKIGQTGAILKMNSKFKLTANNAIVLEADANNNGTFEFHTEVGGSTTKKVEIDNPGNLLLAGGSAGTSGVGVLAQKTATAPSSSPVDEFQMYSADQTAGNACPHFRTELGNVIKLYQQALINDPSGGATVDSNARTAINAILDILENTGLMSAT